jgi:serine/threonine-protein kinase RsbW
VYHAAEVVESRISVKQCALADAVPAIRAAVSCFLDPWSIDPARLADILLAATEACSNVVRHAYPEKPGSVRCDVQVTESEILLSVYDWGVAWETLSATPGAGLGMPLIGNLADKVQRTTEGDTKCLGLRFVLTRPPLAVPGG